ncbi:MAG: hypothetical protein HQK50_06645 [Oligoflexia bacterium]|nr:hypothetical protein [Oligoflexia bacterium]MBF0365231.1 hypothetical protein [Oligoflexia bacterium]
MKKTPVPFCECPKCGYTSARGKKCAMCGKQLIPPVEKTKKVATEVVVHKDAESAKAMSPAEYDLLFSVPKKK